MPLDLHRYQETNMLGATERRRKKEEQNKFRLGHVLWSAIKIAIFAWVAIKIWQCCMRRRNKRRAAADMNAGSTEYAPGGSYAKLEDGTASHADPYASHWAPPVAPSSDTPYGAGGIGYYAPDAAGKYEPMGYSGATIAPSPINSPDLSSSSTVPYNPPAQVSPPPYEGPPPASAPSASAPPAGGAAQQYYAMSAAATAPAPTPSLSQVVAYPPPTHPESGYPGQPTYAPPQ
jgi:hypothetical protein